jgi:hypothetical protein
VTDYYGELGVSPDASAAELRRAFRARARQLHPDLQGDDDRVPGADGEAMGRLNEAWRVLGDPRSRQRYDASLAARDPRSVDGSDVELSDAPVTGHRLRPSWWLVAVAILAAIFVITAYAAGPARVNQTPGTGRPPADQCLARFPGYEAFVSCAQPNLGRVVAEFPAGTSPSCPIGSIAHPVLGRAEVACLATGG